MAPSTAPPAPPDAPALLADPLPLQPVEPWQQRLTARARGWRAEHPELVDRLRVVRSALGWLSLLWLVVVYAARPELRESARTLLSVYWLLVVWFLLLRTKTVSWRLVAGLFALGLPWSLGMGLLSQHLAVAATSRTFSGVTIHGSVSSLGPSVAIAGLVEESLKLVPLALLALLVPDRVRRFTVADWLLVGFASGLSFQAFEELCRRVAANVRPPSFEDIFNLGDPRGPATGYAQYSLSPLGGGSSMGDRAGYAGHHVFTALTTVTVGFAVVAWRHGGRRSGSERWAWRAASVLAPVAAWWLTVAVHSGYNATAGTDGRWLTADRPSVPWAYRATFRLAHHGFGLGWLLLLLALAALLVDAHHRWWAERGTRTSPLRALWLLSVRDLGVVLVAYGRLQDAPRSLSRMRGRAAVAMTRSARADAAARTAGRGDLRAVRLLALVALVAALVATVVVAPRVTRHIGSEPELRWLAGVFDSLGTWWDGLSPGGKLVVGLAIAAAIALSGGSALLAFGLSGVATYLLEHANGAADLVRDPRAAVQSYLEHSTPQSLALDLAETALTFAPGNFAGAVTGRAVRVAAEEYARDPALFLARRRLLLRGLADDTGAIDPGAFLGKYGADVAGWDLVPGKIPGDWGLGTVTKKKGFGVRWADPKNANETIRIDRGDPRSPFPSQRVDHVIINHGGRTIGRDGRPISGAIREDPVMAHIPLSEWLQWSTWCTP